MINDNPLAEAPVENLIPRSDWCIPEAATRLLFGHCSNVSELEIFIQTLIPGVQEWQL